MPSILIAEDQEGLRKALREALRRERYDVEVAVDGEEALVALARRHFDLLVADMRMPGASGLDLLKRVKATDPETQVIVMTAFGEVSMAVEAMKAGAFDFIGKPFPGGIEEFILIVRKALDRQQLVRENLTLRQNLSAHYDPSGILWKSPRMASVVNLVKKVASTDSTVLIAGESGTGKELVAHAIHNLSTRSSRPLVKASCAVFSEGVLESEIFGHEKGAFTGAHARKPGRFELADGGTLFLDEVNDLSLGVQVKLLRVLQEREFDRVGGTAPVKVDVRLIAATNRDLREMVRKGTFREDLFFRLNVVTVELPPLRERKEDIPDLAQYFIQRYRADSRATVKGITPKAQAMLQEYSWPGNVRELENAVQRALVLTDGEWIEPQDLPADVRLDRAMFAGGAGAAARSREEVEKAGILEALNLERGNRSRAASRLNLNRTTLLYKMKKYGIEWSGGDG